MNEWGNLLTPGVLSPLALIGLAVVLVFTGKLTPYNRTKQLEAENKHLRDTVTSLTASVALYAKAAEIQTQTAAITETVIKALQKEGSTAKAGEG